MNTELKPCPFCGSHAESANGFSPCESITFAWCSNPDCRLNDVDIGITPEEWNQRVQPVSAGPTDAQIKAIFIANGFTIKEGNTDLKSYVYAAARALLSAARQDNSNLKTMLELNEWRNALTGLCLDFPKNATEAANAVRKRLTDALATRTSRPVCGSAGDLPPLPEPDQWANVTPPGITPDYYTEAQMQEYALAAISHVQQAPSDTFARARDLTKSWPAWKRDYKFTQNSAQQTPVQGPAK